MIKTTISKTYRIKSLSIKRIEDFAKSQNISQEKAIEKLISMAIRYLEEQQLEKELDDLSNDQKWTKENLEWVEFDLN